MPESQHSPRHGDYTGRVAARLKAAHAEELAQRRQQIGLTDQGPVQEFDRVYDPKTQQPLDISEEEARRLEYRPADDGEVPEEIMEVGPDFVVMRVNTAIEQMTYGVGTSYDFQPGKKYWVSPDLYQHLASRGLVVS
jgi:hypothetical protein